MASMLPLWQLLPCHLLPTYFPPTSHLPCHRLTWFAPGARPPCHRCTTGKSLLSSTNSMSLPAQCSYQSPFQCMTSQSVIMTIWEFKIQAVWHPCDVWGICFSIPCTCQIIWGKAVQALLLLLHIADEQGSGQGRLPVSIQYNNSSHHHPCQTLANTWNSHSFVWIASLIGCSCWANIGFRFLTWTKTKLASQPDGRQQQIVWCNPGSNHPHSLEAWSLHRNILIRTYSLVSSCCCSWHY